MECSEEVGPIETDLVSAMLAPLQMPGVSDVSIQVTLACTDANTWFHTATSKLYC